MNARRTLFPLALVAAVLVAVGCSAPEEDPAPTQTPDTSPTSDTSPSPSQTFAYSEPDADDPLQLALATVTPDGAATSGTSVSGPLSLSDATDLVIEARCVGDAQMSWAILSTEEETAGDELQSGTMRCGEVLRRDVSERLPEAAGPIQLAITSADGVERGWVQATTSERAEIAP